MARTVSGLLRQWRSASIVLTTGTIFLIAVASLVFPINGYAHDGDSNPNVIHACVQQGSKQVRIVGVNGSCTNSETAAHWAVVGPAGPAGPQGPAGPAAAGLPGPAGAAGATGPQGPAGPAGATGPQGPAGATGATGPQGEQGPAGAQGEQGPAGANGAPGLPGQDGAQGPTGAQGPAGTPAVLGMWMISGLPDIRLNSTNTVNLWYVVTGRKLQINKLSSTSKLRITYQDSLGAKATVHDACQWRIVMDLMPTPFSRFSSGDFEGSPYGWRIVNGARVAWALDIPAGPHEVRVEFRRVNATDCLSGWNTEGNFLSVEEIP